MQSAAPVTRVIAETGLSYADAVNAFESTLGQWDAGVEADLVGRKAPWSDLQAYVGEVAGSIGLIRFHKVDQGLITSLSGKTKECALYLVGNPETANGILDIDVRAALYVPFRVSILATEPGGEAFVVYDLPSSSLATLENPALDEVGRALDGRMVDVLARMKGNAPG